jgi:3-oxoacyl-[acyl-carrier protein] reductase
MNLELADKIALITGSSRGLGLASAISLAREGCKVMLTARGADRLALGVDEVCAVADSADAVRSVTADLSTADGVAEAVEQTVTCFGGLDILINNMGLAKGAGLLETSDLEWQDAFEQTLYPAIRASRLAVPHMRARGGGVIIMITSIWGRESGGRMTYNAVKAAETSLAKALAQQLAADQIRVLSIAPGSILFPGGSWHKRQQADPGGIAEFVNRDLPFGRFGRADEVGDVVAFMASRRASWVSGASIVVDGCQSKSNL